jgi:hypothetical protein
MEVNIIPADSYNFSFSFADRNVRIILFEQRTFTQQVRNRSGLHIGLGMP